MKMKTVQTLKPVLAVTDEKCADFKNGAYNNG
jgi:hypothetical protein